MKSLSIKLDKSLLNEIDKNLVRHRYSTRTEFIRDAVRDKLSDLEKEELLKKVSLLYGASKRRTTDDQLHQVRKKLEKDFEGYFK